jgi:hypothetical protein
MMDGRIGAIRDALDSEGFTETSITAYSVCPRFRAKREQLETFWTFTWSRISLKRSQRVHRRLLGAFP